MSPLIYEDEFISNCATGQTRSILLQLVLTRKLLAVSRPVGLLRESPPKYPKIEPYQNPFTMVLSSKSKLQVLLLSE